MNLGRKGQKLSEEHKRKISEAHIGMKHTEESKKKMSEAKKGKEVSSETRAKISLANKGCTPWNKGKKCPEISGDKNPIKRPEVLEKIKGKNHYNWKGGGMKQRQEKIAERPRPNRCEICNKSDKKICFDHDHETGRFRGWICHKCNTALGLVNDDIEILKALIIYLTQRNFKASKLTAGRMRQEWNT